ncbi:MAG: hypothetical protein PHR47_00660 [Candidatus Pacebacteria bacterium]|nr:hypothetical protein [Candidatus Paceibacterota bacterium]
MKKYFYSLLAVILFIPFGIVSAFTLATGESIFSQGESIYGNALLAGSSVTIDNEITGDAFVFGEKIFINGKIDGDLICAAKEIIVNGEIGGNIRCVFEEIKINSKIERSILGLGKNIFFEKNSSVGRDIVAIAGKINVDGTVSGSLDIISSILNINGIVRQNVNFYSEEQSTDKNGLFVDSGSTINGDVNYNAYGEIKGDSGRILGETNKNPPKVENKNDAKNIIFGIIGFLVTLIVTAFAIVIIGGKEIENIERKMINNIWKAVGVGAISFFMFPIAGAILIITGMGAFLGIICFLVWFTILLLSLFFSGIALGELLVKKIAKKESSKILVNSLIGVIIGCLLIMIPYLGLIFFVFGLWWGIGGAVLLFAEKRKG